MRNDVQTLELYLREVISYASNARMMLQRPKCTSKHIKQAMKSLTEAEKIYNQIKDDQNYRFVKGSSLDETAQRSISAVKDILDT